MILSMPVVAPMTPVVFFAFFHHFNRMFVGPRIALGPAVRFPLRAGCQLVFIHHNTVNHPFLKLGFTVLYEPNNNFAPTCYVV